MDLVRHVNQTKQPGRQASESVQKLVGGDPASDGRARALASEASPINHVSGDDAPFLVVHGTADPLVHLDQASRFVDALKRAGVEAELVEVEGAGHAGGAFWSEDLRQRYAAFFGTHLRP